MGHASQFAQRERYSAAYNREQLTLDGLYRASAKEFAEALTADFSLELAFGDPQKHPRYDIEPKAIKERHELQSAAGLALHAIWKDFVDGKAQTAQEKAVGALLAKIIGDQIEMKACDRAEAEIES